MARNFWSQVNRCERVAYSALRTTNDVKAVAKGRAARRILRRAYGRAAGQLAGKLFR